MSDSMPSRAGTWDEDTTKERMVLKKRKFSKDELEKIDYSNYLASDTEDSDSDEDDARKNAFRVRFCFQ